jgi:hypothetical protein
MSNYADRPHVDTNARIMTLGDVIQLLCYDSGLRMREKDVMFLQAHAKMTNPDEMNGRSAYGYNRFRFVEFIDLLGHVADFNFKGSELAGLSMSDKLWFVLNEVFKIVGRDDEGGEGEQEAGSDGSSETLNTENEKEEMDHN